MWNLTYREAFAVIAGEAIRRRRDHEMHLWAAWHGAALARQKRLPKLATLLRKLEPMRVMSGQEMRAAVLGIAKAFGATVVYRKKGEHGEFSPVAPARTE